MRTKQKRRIKLLNEARDIIGKTVNTDGEMYDRGVRRDNRKVEKMIREMEDWVKDLQQEEIVSEVQDKINEEKRNKRKEYDPQRVSWYQ